MRHRATISKTGKCDGVEHQPDIGGFRHPAMGERRKPCDMLVMGAPSIAREIVIARIQIEK